jgi:hypothetical protein
MDQDDGGVGAGRVARETEHGDMQPNTLNLDKLARWRMCGLKPCNA